MTEPTTNIVTLKDGPSVINDMASRFGMDKRAFEATIRQTCMPAKTDISNEQFVAFLLVAKQYNLNPITKEIYAFPAKNGGIQPIVGVDGWCNIINSHPQLDGIEFRDTVEDGKLMAITCKIYRKDRAHPVETTEYMSECKRDTDTWKKWPARMLRHKALIQAARYAFGFSGLVDPDEAERAIEPDTKIRPYEIDVTKPKTPFKNQSLRSQFVDIVNKEYDEAKSLQELTMITDTRKEILDAMAASGDERDTMCYETIDLKRRQIEARFLIATRETPEDESSEFIDDVPPFLKRQMIEEQERQAALGVMK